ncbi:Cytochrome b [Atta colombica]|uniref:Cytochrome b n=1 Tax=Atta colombica TaxID=520822 RepID=A0A151I383_9HYME|nr:Cytochrome b [Atta colombica]
MELNLQQRVCIKFCIKNVFIGVKTLEMLGNCFGSNTLKKTAVYEWHKRFKSGRESVEYDECSGKPSTSKTDENINKVREMLINNRKLIIRELAEDLNIAYGFIQDIVVNGFAPFRQKRKDLWANNSWILHHDNCFVAARLDILNVAVIVGFPTERILYKAKDKYIHFLSLSIIIRILYIRKNIRATVITNLISTIPYIGSIGGFSINNSTLNRFFSFHFILSFIILLFIIFHLFFLHLTESSNLTGTNRDRYKVPFHSYFTFKDLLGFNVILSIFLLIILQYPYIFRDSDNFTPANHLVTHIHIQSE